MLKVSNSNSVFNSKVRFLKQQHQKAYKTQFLQFLNPTNPNGTNATVAMEIRLLGLVGISLGVNDVSDARQSNDRSALCPPQKAPRRRFSTLPSAPQLSPSHLRFGLSRRRPPLPAQVPKRRFSEERAPP